MRSFAISTSLESLQEIQDTMSLSEPLYQYRLQTDTLPVLMLLAADFIINFLFPIDFWFLDDRP